MRDLPVEHLGDVNVVVGLPTIDQPDLWHVPRLQAFVLKELRVGEPVAGVGIDRGQGQFPGGSMVGVTARAEARPVPLGDHVRMRGATGRMTRTSSGRNSGASAKLPSGRPKKRTSSDPRMAAASRCSCWRMRGVAQRGRPIEAAGITVREKQVGDLATGRTRQRRAARPELGVVRCATITSAVSTW